MELFLMLVALSDRSRNSGLFLVIFIKLLFIVSRAEVAPSVVGQWPGTEHHGDPRAVKIVGNTAYVLLNGPASDSLLIADVSNPSSFKVLSAITIPGTVKSVFVFGDNAFIAAGDAGLQIVNVVDRANPLLIGSYASVGAAVNVYVTAATAFLCSLTGLNLLDIENPRKPLLLTRTLDYTTDVKVRGSLVFAGTWRGLQIFSLAGTNLVTLGGYDTGSFPSSVHEVFLQENLLFLAGDFGLSIADVTDPAKPHEIGRNYDAVFWSVVVTNHIAFVVNPSRAIVEAIDVSKPDSPTSVGFFRMPYYNSLPYDAALNGNLLYVAAGSGGLEMLDISNPSSPHELARLRFDIPACISIGLKDQYVYLAQPDNGVHVIDVSKPDSPQELGLIGETARLRGIAVRTDFALMGSALFNISNAAHPTLVTAYDFGIQSAYDIPGRNAIFASTGLSSIPDVHLNNHIIDLSNSATAILVDTYLPPARGFSTNLLAVDTGPGEVSILDVSNFQDPGTVTKVDGGLLTDMATVGNLVFIANGGLTIYDISDPAVPVRVADYREENSLNGLDNKINAFFVSDGLAFLGTKEGISILDVSEAGHPTRVAKIPLPDVCEDLIVLGNLIYAADSRAGLQIVNYSGSLKPVLNTVRDKGSISLQINSLIGNQYVLERVSSLSTTNSWQEISAFTITNRPQRILSASTVSEQSEFYRLRSLLRIA